MGMLLNGQIMDEWDARGQHVRDDILLLLLNAHHEPIPFVLPGMENDPAWEVLLDTDRVEESTRLAYQPGQAYPLEARSLVLLCQRVAWQAEPGQP